MGRLRNQLRRLSALQTSPTLLGCLLPFLISGGSSIPAIIIPGPVARMQVSSIRHRDSLYVPVAAIARSYGLILEEDDGRFFTFGSNRIRLRVEAGSPEVTINGETFLLEDPVDWREGVLIAPIYLALVSLPGQIDDDDLIENLAPGKEGIRVVLDPGHGGVDPGAVGEGLLLEKDVVLEIARSVRAFLEGEGYRVTMTRNDDRYVSLRHRIRLANRLRADLFVSIHANAALNHLARGTETFYYAPAGDPWSRTVAQLENAALRLENPENPAVEEINGEVEAAGRRRDSARAASGIQKRLAAATRTPNRGVKKARFYVLRRTRMPSILVETGFLSNSQERDDLADGAHRAAVAEAIALGIRDYLERAVP